MGDDHGYDFDWLVVGSGFGGAVSALRLREKAYSVGVLECGRRFEDEDFAKTTWELGRYYWMPKLGMRGILRLTLFKDVFIASGCGVGGGSLGYANTLYRPVPGSRFYSDPQWAELADWEDELAPHYEVAERMLGVTTAQGEGPADELLKDLADELGVPETYKRTRVGVYFGEPGETHPDPYFGGEGPARAGCQFTGACMLGCRWNAKNTLMKNYLWFAERAGVRIVPDRIVVDVRPLGAADGADGYEVVSERPGAWVRRDRQVHRARSVVIAAGALGTNDLLQRCRRSGSLPRISDRLGHRVRTNSENISAVTTKDDRLDFTKSIAISSSIYPDEDTHIENVTYGRGADSMSFLFTAITGRGNRLTRPLKWLLGALRHPVRFARTILPFKWSRRTVILLTMQTLDNSMRLRPKRRLLGRGPKLQTEEDPESPNPRFIEVADTVTRRSAEKLDATPQSGITEALLNVPTTAHIMGGAVIGPDPTRGVIDERHRVYGYENLLVCDGAAIPANVGVNPSLTITAMTERAMSHVPERAGESGPSSGAVAASAAVATDAPAR
jgi:cholesterol oxidase